MYRIIFAYSFLSVHMSVKLSGLATFLLLCAYAFVANWMERLKRNVFPFDNYKITSKEKQVYNLVMDQRVIEPNNYSEYMGLSK